MSRADNLFPLVPSSKTEETHEEFLAHYGVLGTRWGVRKGRGHQAAVRSVKKLRNLDKDAKEASKMARKSGSKEDRQAAQKKIAKAKKWASNMNKILPEKTITALDGDKELKSLGKKYALKCIGNEADFWKELAAYQMKQR